ncbi:glycosyltransferase family 2 protein [Miltoncostaea marina]|uniref:glycosyltransferase family 2 protein n=1 Tax=Miltoncostaea marina TaxID=2843215 RepID=UPI0024849D74|nr:glycosyltransferase family 2 protein [Miltoncostaea marina]
MSEPEPPPLVTVIMPIRNEEAFIARSLGAVLAQDYPAERLQVLVADGMSDDGTRSAIARLAEAHPAHEVEIVDNPGRVVPTGFNAALDRARGDVIVRVDGHTIIEPNYVAECVAALRETGADNVGGRMDAVSDGPVGQAIALATSSPFGVGDSQFHYASGQRWVDSVYMGAWPREVFDRVGRFDPEMTRNQDDEFNYRLGAAGGRILLTDRIRSRYYNRSSLTALFRQYRQYGHWKVRVLQKHPRQMSARQFVPPLFVAALAGGAALAPFSRVVRRLWLGLAGAYGLANLAASAAIARRAGLRHMARLPVVFGALHIGYGAGFLGGLVRFRDRWRG